MVPRRLVDFCIHAPFLQIRHLEQKEACYRRLAAREHESSERILEHYEARLRVCFFASFIGKLLVSVCPVNFGTLMQTYSIRALFIQRQILLETISLVSLEQEVFIVVCSSKKLQNKCC